MPRRLNIAPSPNPQAYTPQEFCSAYRIGRSKFYELVRCGALKTRKVGGKTLVGAADAKDWFEGLPSTA